MSGWISSKLKVAESLLQQIDQQAAESLKKSDKPQSPSSSQNEISNSVSHSTSSPPPPLKFQLPRKTILPRSPSPRLSNRNADDHDKDDIGSVATATSSNDDKKKSDPSVIDWTELLSSPSPSISPNIKKKVMNKPVVTIPRVLSKKELIHDEEKKEAEEETGSSGSDSETESSDSEDERRRAEERRKRREEMIKRKAAEAAEKAIKEREDEVARLEAEKESLERVLEERAKEQAQEASELQTNMIETMEAVDLEKQKHNSTRMEAFARMAELETTNAELARSLASAQWNLEVEIKRISEIRQKIELMELAQAEHKRRLQNSHKRHSSLNKEELLRKEVLEQEILDAEYSVICNKIASLKDKAKMLEENIESTKKERLYSSEVELELKRRLTQLTDHLIQKQTQVEALSSEKATLSLRIEMASRMLEENGSSLADVSHDASFTSIDIESGDWNRSSKSAALQEKIRSGKEHLGTLIHQLDILFSAGAVFIRRNPKAQIYALVYFVILHIWVMYILFGSHSEVKDSSSANGAVFSLEGTNKTSG